MNEVIKYRTPPSDEQIENLRAFTTRGERSDPVTFAGRDDILRTIPTIIQNKRDDPSLKSITQIIRGAPGAGKTCLLNELERTNQGDHVSVVRLDGEDLSEPLRVAEQFMDSVGADASDIGAVKSRTHQSTADIAFAKHQEGWEKSKTSALDRIGQGASVWHTLKPLLNVDDNHVFLLLVDEAQRVEKTNNKNVNEIVTSLHTGGRSTAGLRILPIYTGLPDTVDQLFTVGLSRESVDPYRLGALSLGESEIAAEGFLSNRNMGLDEALTHANRTELARALAVASEGWPRHLHRYETGFAQALISDLDRPQPTETVSLESVLEFGHRARVNFYATRLRLSGINAVIRNALKALTKEMISETDRISQDDVEQYMADHYSEVRIDVDEQINKAIHIGMLEPTIDAGYYRYSVPSFSTFMACKADREATLENMRVSFEKRLKDVIGESSTDRSTGLARD